MDPLTFESVLQITHFSQLTILPKVKVGETKVSAFMKHLGELLS